MWSAKDRLTGAVVALKILSEEASEVELLALVREAVALSGLEGLGVPRVLRFGRFLPSGDRSIRRAYMARELVEGESLSDKLRSPDEARASLGAVADAAFALTVLHRAGLLHGDMKPANIIVGPAGATLVDLGLAAAFIEGGARPLGLSPRYAAPELFEGRSLTARSEVFALGATLRDVLEAAAPALDDKTRASLDEIVKRATRAKPDERFPSADELASALSSALRTAGLSMVTRAAQRPAWPVVALDEPARKVTEMVESLPAGGGVAVTGPAHAGRSTLLRRVAWSLGARGAAVAHVEGKLLSSPDSLLEAELPVDVVAQGLVIVVDDFDALPPRSRERIAELRGAGARLLVVGSPEGPTLAGPTLHVFEIRPLDDRTARELVLRVAPSLGRPVVGYLIERSGGWPGKLRALCDALDGHPVVTPEDVDRVVSRDAAADGDAVATLALVEGALDRGHFEEAGDLIASLEGQRSLGLAVARARLSTSRGDTRTALEALQEFEEEAEREQGIAVARFYLHRARAYLRAGDHTSAERSARQVEAKVVNDPSAKARAVAAEAVSVIGIAQSLSSRHDEAKDSLVRAVDLARDLGEARLLSVCLGSLAFALQRNDELSDAEAAYLEALDAAERAGDAGTVATTRLNLATIARTRSEIGATLEHLEAAVDMGRRSGRTSTVRQALLNLANLDLYLGRLAKAQASIDALARERDDLSRQMTTQLFALEAEAAGKGGDTVRAYALCQKCADAYVSMGQPSDAAEARLEGILWALEAPSPDLASLSRELDEIDAALEGGSAHRALTAMVRGSIHQRALRLDDARRSLDAAVEAAEAAGLNEWRWRALKIRAEVVLETGETLAARKDRELALSILESIAAKLPRDLREVYWNDPTRRSLRRSADLPRTVHEVPVVLSNPAQDRLARLLEINREIAGTYDLPRLLERVTDHAIAFVSAERGFVILKSRRTDVDGALSIHASRGDVGDDPHGRFSRSIAEKVIASGEPVVSASARDDSRMANYVSVHRLLLQSIACVPIRSRSSGVIGALYLETRLHPGAHFEGELPLLTALADQVAIAIETARLVSENERRTDELAKTNSELDKAREKLEELLDHRTAQLSATRRDLRSARAVLRSHFGYDGLVGTSEAMRRVYALVDRIKDTDVPVLIMGESGTGKEIIARAIHNSGVRAKKTFVGINCGAIPQHLLESELFGHVRGAFTGAERDRRGLFREATEGTVLLDEIGEMPQKMQAGLLRVLQEKLVRPVGSAKEEPVDTRVVAATHRDLAAMVEAGTFREDLYYRLNVIQVRVPPLRERLDDIPVLIDHFLGIFAARYNRERRSVSRAALKMLMGFRWPGNVRQLENVLLNAWVLSDAPELEPDDFETAEVSAASRASKPAASPPSGRPSPGSSVTSLDQHRDEERERILAALTSANWNRVKAAELIGMPRRTFYRRLKEYGIQ